MDDASLAKDIAKAEENEATAARLSGTPLTGDDRIGMRIRKTGNPAWKKGVSGNPNGRPAVPSLKNALQKRFKQLLAEHEQKLIEALPEIRPALIAEAAKGSIAHISEVHKVVGAHKKSEGNNVPAIQINFKDDKAEFE